MPIPLKCQCGKALKIPDTMAGKAVKCPGCGTVLKVTSAGQPAAKKPAAARPSPTRPSPTRPAPASQASDGGLGDLFDEEGFSQQVAAVCPSCAAEMNAGAVLCTKCGFHREHGVKLDAHKTIGVDISHGELALQKAAADMDKAAAIQAKLDKGPGMPWWGLALVLFMLFSGITLAVIAISISRRVDQEDGPTFDTMKMFLNLTGAGFMMVGLGGLISVVVHAFKQDKTKGFLSLTGVYLFYHVFKNARATWRPAAVGLFCVSIAVGCLVTAAGRG